VSEHLFGDAKATARTFRKTGLAAAIDEARLAYEEDKANGENALQYAELLNRANNLSEAYAVYKDYLARIPANQDIVFEVALLAKTLENKEEAIELFKKTIEMSPGNPLARSAEYELWALNGGGKLRWSKEDK
jgi:tetratricopeptide (TPR) repeat protein